MSSEIFDWRDAAHVAQDKHAACSASRYLVQTNGQGSLTPPIPDRPRHHVRRGTGSKYLRFATLTVSVPAWFLLLSAMTHRRHFPRRLSSAHCGDLRVSRIAYFLTPAVSAIEWNFI